MLYDSLSNQNNEQNLSDICQDVISIQIVAKVDFIVDGMVSLLENQAGKYNVTIINPDNFEIDVYRDDCPDVVLINSSVLNNTHRHSVREIHQLCRKTIVLLFGQSMTEQSIYDAIRAGARGYLNEKMRGNHLINALEQVTNGGYWVERHMMNMFVSDKSTQDKIEENIAALSNNLTVRESEVLELILEGMTTNDIAERIFLSHQGVKAHLTSLFRKFEVKNRAQLIIHVMDVVCPVDSLATMAGKGLKSSRQKPDSQSGIR